MKQLLLLLTCCSFALFAQIRDYCWVKTHSWQGNGHISTEDIKLFGDKWRISYKTAGRGSVRIILAGEDGMAKTIVGAKDQDSGRTYPAKPNGMAHLSIFGPSNGWTVEVEEYMDTLQEWRFRQWREGLPKPDKFAVWAGTDNEEIVFEAPSGKWCITSQALSAGLLKVVLTNEQGRLLYDNFTVSKNTPKTGWIYQGGTVHLKISASDVKWRVEVNASDTQD